MTADEFYPQMSHFVPVNKITSCFLVSCFAILSINPLPQNQFGYRDGGSNSVESSVAGAPACVAQEASGSQGPTSEDQRCNGSLHKKGLSQAGGEDSGGQRYSADPTIFLGERGSRGDTDEDGYMTPMKDKTSSGTGAKNEGRECVDNVATTIT